MTSCMCKSGLVLPVKEEFAQFAAKNSTHHVQNSTHHVQGSKRSGTYIRSRSSYSLHSTSSATFIFKRPSFNSAFQFENIWRKISAPWQLLHSGILCLLTSRTAPQCPFLNINLKLSFLKKHFYNFLATFFITLKILSIFFCNFLTIFIFIFLIVFLIFLTLLLLSAFELLGYWRYINILLFLLLLLL